jgi:EpsD family peptidyl-prolyl cis-trans isomerase
MTFAKCSAQAGVRCRRPGQALAAVLMAAALLGCSGKKNEASQTAARVNKDEITVHQINFVLQKQRGLRQDQLDAASHQILERLIDQDLALSKAEDQKLDRDPNVVMALDAARREILAQAYAEKLGQSATKPSADEVQKYYDANPALFSARRVYSIQEIAIEARPEQIPELREQLSGSKTITDFLDYLKAHDIRFSGNQSVRAAEQMPMKSLEALSRMKDGQAMMVPATNGIEVVVLAGSRSQPVTIEQARPAIEQFLLNERKRKLVEDNIKSMRAAARIEYIGKFAPPAAGAASEPLAVTAPPAASASPTATTAPASSGLDSSDISKGMGLK